MNNNEQILFIEGYRISITIAFLHPALCNKTKTKKRERERERERER